MAPLVTSAASNIKGFAQSTPGLHHVTTVFARHRRSALVVGFISGIIVSLGSVVTVFYLADRRDKRRRSRRLRQYGLDASQNSLFEAEAELRARRKGAIEMRSGEVVRGIEGLIGNTPLMRINSLSDATGCEILGKAEFLNPAGSPKDRVALQILNDAEEEGLLHPRTNSCIFEGTVGSTGISLATLARAKGYRCHIVIPDDVAMEKVEVLRKLGAEVERVRPRGIADPKHFVNEARARAEAFGKTELIGPHPTRDERGFFPHSVVNADDPQHRAAKGTIRDDLVVTTKSDFESIQEDAANDNDDDPDTLERSARGFFADQFENPSNFWAHYNNTGPEIWRQTGGMLDAFVAGAGTGGTLSGVAAFLKRACSLEHAEEKDVRVVLADPQGSGLYNRVKYGVLFNQTEKEGTRRRHQVDTVVEGIGINRLTKNLELGLRCIDDAERVTDDEAARMGRHLVLNDGLFLGSSSAVNCVAAVRTALKMKRKRHRLGIWHTAEKPVVVTILCDSGARHLSKFHDDEALRKLGVDHAGSSDISDILSGASAEDASDAE